MAIVQETESLDVLFERVVANKLLLPNFQRDFIWEKDQQRALVASLLNGIPIGSILILNDSKPEFAARGMGTRSPATVNGETCDYLLDGQQRLTSLYAALADPYGGAPWREVFDAFYPRLRWRWAFKVIPADPAEPDPTGYRSLQFRQLREEPEVLTQFVVPFRIKVGDADSAAAWHHPNWVIRRAAQLARDQDASVAARQARTELARMAGADGFVPLWEVYRAAVEGEPPLHRRVLQGIGRARAAELEAFIRDGGVAHEALRLALLETNPDALTADNKPGEGLEAALRDLGSTWAAEVAGALQGAVEAQLPLIALPESELDRAIAIFEVMNRGGTPLTTFDLVVARMARHAMNQGSLVEQLTAHVRNVRLKITDELRSNAPSAPDDWAAEEHGFILDENGLTPTFKNAFLSTLSIMSHASSKGITSLTTDALRDSSILRLSGDFINSNWEKAATSLLRACAFLQIRCGLRRESDLRNKLILLPIAQVFSDETKWGSKKSLDQTEFWYWCSVLGGSYTERQNERGITDLKQLWQWVVDGGTNEFAGRRNQVLNAVGYSDEDTLLRKGGDVEVAADVGAYLAQWVLSRCPWDFLKEERLCAWNAAQTLELHHLVPLGSAKTVGTSAKELRDLKDHVLNSPLNMTYLLKETNATLSSLAPSTYLKDVSERARTSHVVPAEPGGPLQLTGDDYYRERLRLRLNHLRDAVTVQLDKLVP